MKSLVLLSFGLGTLALAGPARADEANPPDPFAAFPQTPAHDKHYFRAGLEVGGVVTVGLVDYLLNTGARGGTRRAGDLKWDLRYDPALFRGKFTGASYSWDSNRFGTNFASHPFAGTMYFTAARSNHLSFVESYLYAVGGSLVWEYFGEIREINSINDMIVTPVSGAAIGETMMQLAGFFDRGDARPSNQLLSFLFAPWKFINEGTDGVQTLRTAHPDGLGFPSEPWHRFTLDVGGGATIQEGATREHAAYTDFRTSLKLDLANLPDYAGAGDWSRVFDDGNRTSLLVEGAMSNGHLVDGRFATRVVPYGYYYRHAALDRAGRLRGDGALVGFRMGFEYATHDYDRDRARPPDVSCIVSPLGVAAEYAFDAGGFHVRTSLDLSAGLAGITPYALTDFETGRGRAGLPTVTRNNGYDYSLAIVAEPQVELAYRTLHWSSGFRLDTFRGARTLDESPSTVDPRLSLFDRRTGLRTSLAWEPGAPRFALGVVRNTRSGEVAASHAARSETSLFATTGVVF